VLELIADVLYQRRGDEGLAFYPRGCQGILLEKQSSNQEHKQHQEEETCPKNQELRPSHQL